MSILLLVPGLISFFLVWRGRIETAFLSVYLPCLLLLPNEYSLRIPHLPPLSTAEFALIPLGAVAFTRQIRSGSFALMDLLVVLFAASVSLSEILHDPVVNDGIFAAITSFISMVLAYAVGRQLIEPDLRLATMRRWVILVLLNGPTILLEWRLGQNMYGMFGQNVLGLANVSAGMQFRNGHARIGAVFGGGEDAGIAFGMAFCLHAWLVYLKRVKAPVGFGGIMTKLEKYHVPGMLLVLYVWLTQSRGPLLSLGAGYLILQISRFQKTRLMTIVVAVMLVSGYLATSAYFASYTNVTEVTSEQQSSAVYRRDMNRLYAPVAELGGWTGWGVKFPRVGGMGSIDNNYLLYHLLYGRLGYILFVLIAWENIRVLLVRSWKFESAEDRAFVISMLATMTVLWLTLLTVFMGEQLPQMSFLLMGWIQSMVPGKAASSPSAQLAENRNQKFALRRVFS